MRAVIYSESRAPCAKMPTKIGWLCRGLGCTVYLFLKERRLEIPALKKSHILQSKINVCVS